LSWFFSKQKLLHFDTDSWDFGLTGDATPYRGVAKMYDTLWTRLDERYVAMEEIHLAAEKIAELKRKVERLKTT
jgi:hypothetical protein